MAEGEEAVEVGEEDEVVLGVLGEAEAGVDDHAVGCDAAVEDGVHACVEFVDDLCHDVGVGAFDVAVLQEAAPVHDDEGAPVSATTGIIRGRRGRR